MCKSTCNGSCSLALKQMNIDSEQALTQVADALDKISLCLPGNDSKLNKNFTSTLNELKMEINSLREEAGRHEKQFANAANSSNSPSDFESSFKEKVKHLKEKINSLETSI